MLRHLAKEQWLEDLSAARSAEAAPAARRYFRNTTAQPLKRLCRCARLAAPHPLDAALCAQTAGRSWRTLRPDEVIGCDTLTRLQRGRGERCERIALREALGASSRSGRDSWSVGLESPSEGRGAATSEDWFATRCFAAHAEGTSPRAAVLATATEDAGAAERPIAWSAAFTEGALELAFASDDVEYLLGASAPRQLELLTDTLGALGLSVDAVFALAHAAAAEPERTECSTVLRTAEELRAGFVRALAAAGGGAGGETAALALASAPCPALPRVVAALRAQLDSVHANARNAVAFKGLASAAGCEKLPHDDDVSRALAEVERQRSVARDSVTHRLDALRAVADKAAAALLEVRSASGSRVLEGEQREHVRTSTAQLVALAPPLVGAACPTARAARARGDAAAAAAAERDAAAAHAEWSAAHAGGRRCHEEIGAVLLALSAIEDAEAAVFVATAQELAARVSAAGDGAAGGAVAREILRVPFQPPSVLVCEAAALAEAVDTWDRSLLAVSALRRLELACAELRLALAEDAESCARSALGAAMQEAGACDEARATREARAALAVAEVDVDRLHIHLPTIAAARATLSAEAVNVAARKLAAQRRRLARAESQAAIRAANAAALAARYGAFTAERRGAAQARVAAAVQAWVAAKAVHAAEDDEALAHRAHCRAHLVRRKRRRRADALYDAARARLLGAARVIDDEIDGDAYGPLSAAGRQSTKWRAAAKKASAARQSPRAAKKAGKGVPPLLSIVTRAVDSDKPRRLAAAREDLREAQRALAYTRAVRSAVEADVDVETRWLRLLYTRVARVDAMRRVVVTAQRTSALAEADLARARAGLLVVEERQQRARAAIVAQRARREAARFVQFQETGEIAHSDSEDDTAGDNDDPVRAAKIEAREFFHPRA